MFERDCLGRFTPCKDVGEPQLIEAIAVTHVEFIMIHPFRDGNGRLGRLLADVMAIQASHSPLDYRPWDAADRNMYFSAIQLGMGRDYELMKVLVEQALAI